jgi:hypothetical protein
MLSLMLANLERKLSSMDNKVEKSEIVFTEGVFLKEIKPDFISVGIKWLDFCNWATDKKQNGYLNLYICKSKNGKLYARWNESQWRASTGSTVGLDEEKPTVTFKGEDKIPF